MHGAARHVRSCGLFSRLDADRLERIGATSRLREFRSQAVIRSPCEKPGCLFLLVGGLARMGHVMADGKESILAFVEPGEVFGELAICDRGEQDEIVVAAEPCTVVMIPIHEVRQLIAEQPTVALGVIEMINLRRRRVERRFKNLLFKSNRERLVHVLLDLTDQFGADNSGVVRLRIRLSHQDLANMIGATRETVTLILGQLRSDGWVDSGRCRIELTNVRRLAASVNRSLRRDGARWNANPAIREIRG